MATAEAISPTTLTRSIVSVREIAGPRRSTRYDTLDAWRGIACILVVLCHAVHGYCTSEVEPNAPLADGVVRMLRFGSIGVPMFFVISGYCIAATALNAKQRRTPLIEYFRKRFRRIYPSYWAALLLLIAVFLLVDVLLWPRLLSAGGGLRPWWFSGSQWFGSLTLTETWRHHIWGDPLGPVLGPSWTLCFEEQFYLMIGLLLLFPQRMFFWLCGIVTLITLIVQQLAFSYHVNVAGFFFDGYWLAFAFGIAVFLATNRLQARGQILVCAGLLAAALTVLQLPGLENARLGYPQSVSLALAAIFSILLIVLYRWDHVTKNIRVLAPVFGCGTMCYSLYLVHDSIVATVSALCVRLGIRNSYGTLFIAVPLCVVASLLVARLFYLLVESRFLNLSARASKA